MVSKSNPAPHSPIFKFTGSLRAPPCQKKTVTRRALRSLPGPGSCHLGSESFDSESGFESDSESTRRHHGSRGADSEGHLARVRVAGRPLPRGQPGRCNGCTTQALASLSTSI